MKTGLRNKWEILGIQYIGKRNWNNGRQVKSFPPPQKEKVECGIYNFQRHNSWSFWRILRWKAPRWEQRWNHIIIYIVYILCFMIRQSRNMPLNKGGKVHWLLYKQQMRFKEYYKHGGLPW